MSFNNTQDTWHGWQVYDEIEEEKENHHPNFKSIDPCITTKLTEFIRDNIYLGRMLKQALRNQEKFKKQWVRPEEEEVWEPRKKKRRYSLNNLSFFKIQIQCIDRVYYIDCKTDQYNDSIKYFEVGVRVDINNSYFYVVLRGNGEERWDIDFFDGVIYFIKDIDVFIKYYVMENENLIKNKQDNIIKQIKDDEISRLKKVPK